MSVEVVLKDLKEDDIDSYLKVLNDLINISDKIEEKKEKLKSDIVNKLNEKEWESYKSDENGISVKIVTRKKKTVNKKALEMLLSDEQYSDVINKKSYKKLEILTKEDRKRLKDYGK